MSDTGRKGFGEKAEEKITPQSQKSTTDKISEGFTDTTDKVARYGSSLHDYHEGYTNTTQQRPAIRQQER
jgi:hypothetical protein